MIRKSGSKKGKNKSKQTKQSRTSKKQKPHYTCMLCKKDKKRENYSTERKLDMEAHLSNSHDTSKDKGVDLKMFFELLRVAGVIAIVGGIYALGTNLGGQAIDQNGIASEVANDLT